MVILPSGRIAAGFAMDALAVGAGVSIFFSSF